MEFTFSPRIEPEQALISRAHAFEEEALAEIYDRYSPGIYRYAVRLLGESGSAEECVAETFSRFLDALHRGRGPSDHLQAYLYRIAHNWITDCYRRSPPEPLPLGADDETGETGPEVSQTVEDRQQLERIRTALALITPEQRQVIVLKYLEDQANDEIARAIGKPVGAVKALQHRGLAALRRLLSSREDLPA